MISIEKFSTGNVNLKFEYYLVFFRIVLSKEKITYGDGSKNQINY